MVGINIAINKPVSPLYVTLSAIPNNAPDENASIILNSFFVVIFW